MQAKYTQDLTQMAQTIKAQIMDEVEQRMQSRMRARDGSLYEFIQQQQPTPPPHVSTWVSMWPPHPPHPAQKILLLLDGYVDAVAIGTTQPAASTVHHQILDDEWVRVSVDEVIHPEAPLPSTTAEFMTVGDVLHSYVPWPRRLIADMSSKVIKFDFFFS
ncbi:hypothetical protein Fmac_013551 [Flemingia macrophylla]|uniref:DUF8039 domain-containing protein n=1 Tax=Flemingia macrophylla TaxID=520843 RepID=A0ABD1MTG0_9FABA